MKIKLLMTVLLLTLTSALFAQKLTVKGTVKDAANGEPLVGAYVQVKGTNVNAMTDVDGKYSISCPQNAVLMFSYIGYNKTEIPVNGRSSIDVTMQSTNVLDEVVVTAMGMTRSQKSVGYATSTVKSDDLTNAKSSALMTGIQGKVAGVQVSSQGGTGSSQKVIVRGYSSFSSNNPLYVVDGIPMSNGFSGSDSFHDSVDFGNGANDVNPDDVESMTILKGASATALYGSRAANGVIMITTKRAKENKLIVNYDFSYMASNVLRVPQGQDIFGEGWPFYDSAENGSWGPKMDGRTVTWGAWGFTGDVDMSLMPSGYQVMTRKYSFIKNNIRDFYKTGFEMNNNVSVTAGNQDLGMVFSYGNTNAKGVMPNSADTYDRNTISFRGNAKYKKLSIDGNINYVRKDSKKPSAGQGNDGASMFQEILQYGADVSFKEMKDWTDPRFDPDHYYTLFAENPYWVLDHNKNVYQDDRIYGKIDMNYEIIKGLVAEGRIGGDFISSRMKRWNEKHDYAQDSWSYQGGKNALPGTYSENYDKNEELDITGMLKADYKIGEDLNIGGVVGWNLNQRTYSYLNSYLYGLYRPGWFSLENGTEKPLTSSWYQRRRLMGAFAQMDLSYKNWAFLTGTARNDWSSTLPIDSNSFFYWGVNGAVVFTDALPAIKDYKVSFLKLRLAYGKTGNDAPIYRTSSAYTPTQIGLGFGNVYLPMSGTLGLTESNNIPNKELKPEITTEFEVGVTANFFDNRLTFDGAFYDKNTKNQIIAAALAPESGYTTRTRNVGKIGNRGIEIMLGGTPVKFGDWKLDLGVTFTKNWSKVKELWDNVDEYTLTSSYQVSYVAEVGKPLGQFKIPAVAKTADGKTIVTSSGFPKIDSNKMETLGTSNPRFQMGFTTRISWKDLSLSAVVDWRNGGYFYCYTAQLYYFSGNATPTVYNNRAPFIVPNSVKQLSKDTYVENDIPIRTYNTYNWYNNAQNYSMYKNWVLKKDYVKLRELVISYNLPKSICEKVGFIKGVTVSLIGRNLLMWTPAENNFVDPESSNYGNDLGSEFGEFASAPTNRTFGGSVKITF
ncbi:MAG TPA: SusC/RagA family TonB-linked outer membrane protein [Candidatus Egerieousia sp.]|nr:SusC/RagA family TonB-linked outer membrane protein [Candidatus Egerieousia sp.]